MEWAVGYKNLCSPVGGSRLGGEKTQQQETVLKAVRLSELSTVVGSATQKRSLRTEPGLSSI